MKIKKLVSKLLLFSIINSSLNNILLTNAYNINDERYELQSGYNDIFIKDSSQNPISELSIEGSTLLNIATKMDNPFIREGIYYKNNCIQLRHNLKANTTYTRIINITDLDLGTNTSLDMYDSIDNLNGEYVQYPYKGITKPGIIINKFTTGDIDTSSVYTFNPCMRKFTNQTGASIEIDNLLILEGDYTDKNIDFFEGLISSFEDKDMNITLTGKNLWEFGNIIDNKYNFSDTYWVNFEGNTPNMFLNHITKDITDCWVLLERGKTYSFNAKWSKEVSALQFVSEKEKIMLGPGSSYTPSEDTYITIRAKVLSGSEKYSLYDIQIEESTQITEYEPFKKNTIKIPIKEPLRSIPNGNSDKIIYKNNKWYIERNCFEKVIDGSQTASIISEDELVNSNNTINFNISCNPKASSLVGNHYNFISDRFRFKDVYANTSSHRGLNVHLSQIRISLDKTDLVSQDISGLKEYLNNNPIKIIYELNEPIYEELNLNINKDIFNTVSYITINSSIPVKINVLIDTVVEKAQNSLKEAISTPTLHNISLARMWVNQMPESLLKDEMQMRLSEIFNIKDIQLDKKNITSNLDLYIKSENMLSLSLNTNSIAFEDFSGIEDLELNNAVKLTINSSLPYELNTYLVTEIQNSDKSKIMDKSILNIKESSESNYNSFNNINEKLTLKDNNVAGNNIIHSIDLLLRGGISHEKDVYKTTIKFEAKQK